MIPTYQAQFARPLVDQLIAILQRDQQAALDLVNATRPASRALGPFVGFYKEASAVQNAPAIVVAAQQIAFDPQADIGLRAETVQMSCTLFVPGTDPEWLVEDTMDYARAVDMVLTSAALADFYLPLPIALSTAPSGTTSGLSATSHLLDLRVTQHHWSELTTRRGAGTLRQAQIEFVVEMEEQ